MLSAKDAHTKTTNNITECITEELLKLEKQINDAINRGKFSISNNGFLQAETKKRLEELGYKVTVGYQHNETYYDISW